MASYTKSLVNDMETIYNIIMAHLELSPRIVRIFANRETSDKHSNETYKEYCNRIQGPAFNYKEWQNSCRFSHVKFETNVSSDDMDLTALCHLFHALSKTKGKAFPRNFDTALKKLKDLRNEVMHNISEAQDPAAIGKLEAALNAFILEAGIFYSLSASEVRDLQNTVRTEIQVGFSPGTKRLLYAKACLVKEGWTTMKLFLETNFDSENLMFSIGKVKRMAVFHELEVLLREGKNGQPFPYSKIFEKSEKFIIVSGVAGAGKSTLLENIALQFIKPHSGTPYELQDFQLLLYIQCRDHTTRTLSDVMIQQYPDVRTKLGEDVILAALFELTSLFLIDGYDEYSHSMTVLKEVLKKTWRADCRVIITTRPHAVEQLKQVLSNESIKCVEYEIAPLAELNQQLDFLGKYEPHLPGAQPFGIVRESFKTLKEPLRILFTEPLKLIQFCYVCVSCPEKISSWKKSNDVAKSTFDIYRDLVKKKLSDTSYPNLEIVIDDIFIILFESALELLRANVLSFTENKLKQIQRKCLSKLRADHDIKDLDVPTVLSCVFNMKRSFARPGEVKFCYNHKSDQEYFASRCVCDKIRNTSLSVREILIDKESPTDDRFLEVLQYVVQDIGADSPELLDQRWVQLREALQEAGADFSTWRDLVLSCSHDASVVKRLAEAAKSVQNHTWTARICRDVDAIALMLQHAQPVLVEVGLKPDDLRKTRWKEVINNREGHLRIDTYAGWSHLPDETCDDLIEPLRHNNGRCTLEYFKGTISNDVGWTALSAAITATTELDIRLEAPRQLGKQSVELNCNAFTPHKTPLNASDRGDGSVQHLNWSPARLVVKKVVQGSWEAVSNTVLTLAPHGGRFEELKLDKAHNLTSEEVDRVLVLLQRRGVRTMGQGLTRREIPKDKDWRLFVTNDLPSRLNSTRDLFELRDRVVELSACKPEQLHTEWPTLRHKLQAAGACWVDWQDLMLRCPSLEDLARLTAETRLAVQTRWKIRTGHDVTAVARMLPHAQPCLLEVDISPHELRGSSWEVLQTRGEMSYFLKNLSLSKEEVSLPMKDRSQPREDMPPPRDDGVQRKGEESHIGKDLPHPWEEVVRLMKGKLILTIHSDSPCDDLLAPLRKTSAQLVSFRGGIAEAGGVAALCSVTKSTSSLCVRLLTPLSLSALQGRYQSLAVLVRPLEADEGGPWPMPAQPQPELWVTDVPLGAWRDVVHAMHSLAPVSKKYETLWVTARCSNPREFDLTAAALQRLGVRTQNAGLTRWQERLLPSGWYRIKFLITNELPQKLALIE